MNGVKAQWRIQVDTGGTFTDCIAYNPQNQLKRIKVLSSSVLRGKIIKTAQSNKLYISVYWPVNKDIFKNYQFSILGEEHNAVTVEAYDASAQSLTLNHLPQIEKLEGRDFEIYSGEEAPILVARLATETNLDEVLPPMEMRLGSTRGTNALLEHKGAKTILLVTKGFHDLLAIDTQQRPDIFALNIIKPKAYYHHVIEVDERLDAKGNVIKALTKNEVKNIVCQLKSSDTEAVAIALMHSYLNNTHETQLAHALKSAGYIHISCSANLAPSIKILPRAKTALINAYLSPLISNYLNSVKNKLGNSSLKVMTSAGGLVSAELYHPKDSLLSGPAGGVVGAASICRLASQTNPEIHKILAFDMGGTSTDVSRYDGEFDYRYETKVADINLYSPALAIETVAAGGGSCCYFDGHKLSVGPESAGASPGPACYGFEGPLTITDVNLLLGRISEEHFGIPISKAKAKEALQLLKQKMEHHKGTMYTEEEILLGLLSIANEKMCDAIRKISIRKGYDPQEYALLACGGAGGQHACHIAEILGIKKVIVPYDAGLLSAYGMGQATIERFALRQILKPLAELNDLSGISQELQAQALQLLKKEGYENEVEIRFVKLYLRFQGQESSLEIDYHSPTDVYSIFREQYISLYGHWLENQVIEVESIKVVASTVISHKHQSTQNLVPYYPVVTDSQQSLVIDQWMKIPVFSWERLKAGAHINGPALIVSENCTTVVESGWSLIIDHFNSAILQYDTSTEKQKTEQPEAVQLELFTNRFGAIAEEMGALLERTSFSVNVKERLDFSCALLDQHGELVVNAPHIPVHLGSMGICVRSVRDVIAMEEGDVVITNHPRYGGSHLPDITLISPVFYDGKLAGYIANRAHHAELGGKRPGSMPPDARSLAEEGVVISPTYLVRRGEFQWHHIRSILTGGNFPSRAVEENIADLNGALASVHFGVDALQKLCHKHSLSKIHHYMKMLKHYAHTCLQESMLSLGKGKFEAREYLDDGTPIQVMIQLKNEQISINFEGSGAIHPANLNATLAIVNSAVIYVLRLLIKRAVPLNEGIMQSVDLHVPAHTFLNPDFYDDPTACPAVVGGNTESSQRIVDTLLKALGISACSQGTMNNLLFGNKHFGYYETIGGGTGAGEGYHGTHAVHQHMTNTRITDPEVLEFRYPVHLERFSIRTNSGGKGKWNGGDGIVRHLTFLEAVFLTILTQHRKQAPYGIKGGEAGAIGRQYIIRKDGRQELLLGNDQVEMHAGDSILIETPGGGAYGCV
ncbi:hydantoinase B/oxoprolinase family protein [Catalinimonas niigatensis]|uniref:hydantoinase B/oxoprolinase family protein n=1 Tax=Catalinimonas niigatensis TaxID=1397264 RepID=UPI0026655D01|nr:hydantoinase B/oxoprolinase family protein [Catalinimonas niigatensis]WPP51028.1 hydantoinase B/oxoprolinase family protein [Catalinimonas niigatensis]